jgi:hypothetical protein
LAALIVVGPLASVVPANADANQEAQSISLVNSLRRRVGVAPLTVDSRLTAVARAWAARMAANGAISHNPNVQSQAPSDWRTIGENVGFASSVQELQSLWENSPPHYSNQVNSSFTNIGAGIVESGGYLWAVHVFTGGGALGAPASSTPVPDAAPAPAPLTADAATSDQAVPADESAPMDDSVGFYDDEADGNRGPNPALADDPVPAGDNSGP